MYYFSFPLCKIKNGRTDSASHFSASFRKLHCSQHYQRHQDPRSKAISNSSFQQEPLLKVHHRKQEIQELRGKDGPVVQALSFSCCGGYLLIGDDDKEVEILNTSNWKTSGSVHFPKKVSAASFVPNSKRGVAADRFGDLYCFPIDQGEVESSSFGGHFCSIITTMSVSSDGRLLCTSDRDGQTRITALPEDSNLQSCEIHCFCMGHTHFISCGVLGIWHQKTVLVTCGGDGRILFFDIKTGKLLSTFQAQDIMLKLEIEDPPIILSIAAFHKKPYVVLAIENLNLIVLLHWDGTEVMVVSMLSLRTVNAPCCLAVDSDNCLWIVGGPQEPHNTDFHLTALQLHESGSFVSSSKLCWDFLESQELFTCTSMECTRQTAISRALGKRKYSDKELEEKHRKLAYVQHAEYMASIKHNAELLDKE